MLQNHEQLACIRASRQLLSGSRGGVSDTSAEEVKIAHELSCRSSLEWAACIWSASFQELISSPLFPHPSLPLCASSALSQIRLSWDTGSSSGLMLWGILGVSISFTDGWALAVTSTCRGTIAAPATKTCLDAQCSSQGGSMRWSLTNWLGLTHGIFESCSINSLGIHARTDWVLMHKTHLSSVSYLGAHAWGTGVLKHDPIGHSSIYWLDSRVQTDQVLMHIPVGHPCMNWSCAHTWINCAHMNTLMSCSYTPDQALVC